MTWNDHDGDYAEKHHRHYDDESTARGLREDLGRAEERIRELEDGLRDALNRIHALEDRQPDYAHDGPDPDRPETWAFGEAPVQPLRPDEAGGYVCPETSDGRHCGDWHEGGKCGACGQTGPDPDEDQAEGPEPEPYDPGPEIDDEGGMSEYRYPMPEDYERGQS